MLQCAYMNLKRSWKPLLIITGAVLLLIYVINWMLSGSTLLNTQKGISTSNQSRSSGGIGMLAPEPGIAVSDMAVEESMIPIEPPFPPGPGATPQEREEIGERIIRNGRMSIRVDDVETRLVEVQEIVESAGGFIADSNVSERNGAKSASLTARVPSNQFEQIRAQVRDVASTVFNESSHADDVTDQFVDLEARLKAARAEESQYLAILERATTIEETLQVTAQLGQVRSRIEQMEGQLRYLTDRTDYATLTISMTEEARVDIPTDEWRPGEVLRQSIRDLVVLFQSLINFLITALIFIVGLVVPVALFIWLIVWGVKRIMKAMRGKKK